MKAGDQVSGTIGRELVELVEIGDGKYAYAVRDDYAREQHRVTNIRLDNIQKLLEALLEQNRKGVKTKAELSIGLVEVPVLEQP